ncbi:MAG: Guanosine-diphosphatase [Alyxoria varia]|nr:MAG: Guanosine-diphosphatase [Alyxoria varia]
MKSNQFADFRRTGQTASDPSAATSKCQYSYDPSKPLIQYALMVDAGSTGSRIHVYRFNNCGPTPDLEDELFKQTEKKEGGSGLSSYDSDAVGAAQSLDPLLDEALKAVPESYRSCSPIAVKATAGLRKLGAEKSARILAAVRERLDTKYPFPLVSDEKGGVEVMEGTDEGVYAWITTNYLLGKIGGPDKSQTAAVFDLGGGSTQIVFEPTFPPVMPEDGTSETLADGDHKYELQFGSKNFTLYQHSYLGYGLMAARESLHQEVFDAAYDNAAASEKPSLFSKPLTNPCIAPAQSRDVDISFGEEKTKTTVTMVGPESGQAPQCRAIAQRILYKDAPCSLAPCAFAGVHQPPLAKVLANNPIYLFSYFYDRTNPLGMPDSFTIGELKDLTARVCDGGGEDDIWTQFQGVAGAADELKGRPEHCLDLNFMLALLHHGYEMDVSREVRIAKKIKGNELGWCLGASLPLLQQDGSAGWKCKIGEIV